MSTDDEAIAHLEKTTGLALSIDILKNP